MYGGPGWKINHLVKHLVARMEIKGPNFMPFLPKFVKEQHNILHAVN
jgi:hypothetical protein